MNNIEAMQIGMNAMHQSMRHMADAPPPSSGQFIKTAPTEVNDRAVAAFRELMSYAWRECQACNGDGRMDFRCGSCNGSGEGMADGVNCMVCKGRGLERFACTDCDGRGKVEIDHAHAEAERIVAEATGTAT